MRIVSFKLWLLGGTLLMLTACGFHWQGTIQLPPRLKTVYLHSFSPYGLLTKETESMLRFSGIRLVNSAREAAITLDITGDNFSTTQTSIGGNDQLQNYLATYSVTFEIKDFKGVTVVGPATVSDQQSIQVLKDEVLTNSNKLTQAEKELTRKVIKKMFAYLSAKNTIQALEKIRPNPRED